MADQMREIVYEICRMSDREADEREKLVLRLENTLLRFERRLPSNLRREDDEE